MLMSLSAVPIASFAQNVITLKASSPQGSCEDNNCTGEGILCKTGFCNVLSKYDRSHDSVHGNNADMFGDDRTSVLNSFGLIASIPRSLRFRIDEALKKRLGIGGLGMEPIDEGSVDSSDSYSGKKIHNNLRKDRKKDHQ
jgi:hypothetical protein